MIEARSAMALLLSVVSEEGEPEGEPATDRRLENCVCCAFFTGLAPPFAVTVSAEGRNSCDLAAIEDGEEAFDVLGPSSVPVVVVVAVFDICCDMSSSWP